MKLIDTIQGCKIWLYDDGHMGWTADMDIDCDGPNGNPDHDPYWQAETTLRYNGRSIDSYKVPGVVVQKTIINAVDPKVMGCKSRVHYLRTGCVVDAVVYDVGPLKKIGEGSVELAKRLRMPSNPNTGGESRYDMVVYEIWPGVPAVVDGITYNLQASPSAAAMRQMMQRMQRITRRIISKRAR